MVRGDKTQWIKIRVSEAEKRVFDDLAERAGLSLSAWMRERLRKAAIAEAKAAGKPSPF
jgi:hypothetical protein